MTFVLLIEHQPKIQNYKCINYKFVILDNKHNGKKNWECAEFRLSVASIDEELAKLTPSETAVLALVDKDFPSVPNPNEVSL